MTESARRAEQSLLGYGPIQAVHMMFSTQLSERAALAGAIDKAIGTCGLDYQRKSTLEAARRLLDTPSRAVPREGEPETVALPVAALVAVEARLAELTTRLESVERRPERPRLSFAEDRRTRSAGGNL